MTQTSNTINQLFDEAKNGSPVSQFKLAVELSKDKTNAESIEWAFRLFKQFAYADNAEAQYILGQFYEGEYGEKYLDYMEAFKWYEAAKELGNNDAKNAYQNLWLNKVISYKKKLANKGNNKAIYWMAYCCYKHKAYHVANEWLQKAYMDEKNRSHGVLRLRAYMFSEELGFGETKAACEGDALDCYEKASHRGNPEAQFILGLYLSALGSMGYYKNKKPNYDIAYIHLQRAANNGHKVAQEVLSVFFQKGWGVGQNYVEAFRWMYKAVYSAKMTDNLVIFEDAPTLLAQYYTDKLIFDKPDYKEAMILYTISEKLFSPDTDLAGNIKDVDSKLKPYERREAHLNAIRRYELLQKQGALGPCNDDQLDEIINKILMPDKDKTAADAIIDYKLANAEEDVITISDIAEFKHLDKIKAGFDPNKIKITLIAEEVRNDNDIADFDYFMFSYGKFHDKKRVDVFQTDEYKIHPTERKLLLKLAYHYIQADSAEKAQAIATIIKTSEPTVISLYNRMITSIFPGCYKAKQSNMINRRDGKLKIQLGIDKMWNIQNCIDFKELMKI